MQVVERGSLAVNGRLGRVEILRLIVIPHGAPAERDHLARLVMDGKHQAAPKRIVESRAFVAPPHQTGRFKLLR